MYWRLQDCPSSARTPLLMRGRGYFISPVPLSHWRYTELSWSWLFWGACRQPEIWLTYFSDCDCQWHLAVFKQEFRRVCGCGSESLKADSHIACRAAKGLECFPIWFTQCGRVWFTLPMPCPCRAHAMLWPCRSTRGHGTARPSRDGLWATCPRSASSGYHAEFHEECYQKHTNPPHNDPYLRM